MSQTLTRLLIHIVFSTKHREDTILPAFERDLYRYMSGICKAIESPVLEIGGTTNHVHVLTSLSKKVALADLVMHMKKDSSKWIMMHAAEARGFRWQDGHSAFSLGQSGMRGITKYIRTQKEHHKKVSYQGELRLLVKKYDVIEFDERYAWD